MSARLPLSRPSSLRPGQSSGVSAGVYRLPARAGARGLMLGAGLLAAASLAQPQGASAHHVEGHGDDHATHRHTHRAATKAQDRAAAKGQDKTGAKDLDKARPQTAPVLVADAYTLAPRPGVPNLAVFLGQVENHAQAADRLVSAQTEIAKRTELHQMTMDGQVMHMRQLKAVELPAGGTVNMAKGNPNGYHVMVMGVNRTLKAGDSFPLTLRFEQAGEQTVQVQVLDKLPAGGDHAGHDHHGASK